MTHTILKKYMSKENCYKIELENLDQLEFKKNKYYLKFIARGSALFSHSFNI